MPFSSGCPEPGDRGGGRSPPAAEDDAGWVGPDWTHPGGDWAGVTRLGCSSGREGGEAVESVGGVGEGRMVSGRTVGREGLEDSADET